MHASVFLVSGATVGSPISREEEIYYSLGMDSDPIPGRVGTFRYDDSSKPKLDTSREFQVVKSRAVKQGFLSSMASVKVLQTPKTPAPTIRVKMNVVTMIPPPGMTLDAFTVYYTTDGSEPAVPRVGQLPSFGTKKFPGTGLPKKSGPKKKKNRAPAAPGADAPSDPASTTRDDAEKPDSHKLGQVSRQKVREPRLELCGRSGLLFERCRSFVHGSVAIGSSHYELCAPAAELYTWSLGTGPTG